MIAKTPLKIILFFIILLSFGTFETKAVFNKKINFSFKKNSSGEYIILSGGPALRKWEDLRLEKYQHDRWWGNFIRSARARIQELRKEKGERYKITWLVYKPSYESRSTEDQSPLISWVQSVKEKYKVNLVWIYESDEIINYLNQGQDREKIKIDGFEYYGHSNRHAFLIEYSNDIIGTSRVYLHENDLKRIKRSSFNRKANCISYGCHTGESMSKKWKQAIGIKMIGAVGKTDYSNPLKPVVVPPGHWNDSFIKIRLRRNR